MTSSMAATKAALASGGIAHWSFRCGLRTFFERPPDGVVAGARDNVQFDDLALQHLQRPSRKAFGWCRAGQGNQLGLAGAVEYALPGGVRRALRGQHAVDAFLDELLTDARNRHQAGV